MLWMYWWGKCSKCGNTNNVKVRYSFIYNRDLCNDCWWSCRSTDIIKKNA